MSAGRCATFFEAAGYRLVRTASATWFNASARIYRSLPDARCVNPPEQELRELVVSQRLLGVEFANQAGRGMAWNTYRARLPYDESGLHRTFRQNVRRGRTNGIVTEISFDDLRSLGMAVNRDVQARRRWVDAHFVEPRLWAQYCDAGKMSSASALGVFVAGELAGWITAVVEERTGYGLHMMSRHDAHAQRSNNLLYYEFTRTLLQRDDVECVTVGLESTLPAGDIDRFKRHAGYKKEPCFLGAALHPVAAAFLLRRGVGPLLRAARRLVAPHSRLARITTLSAMAQLSRVTQVSAHLP